MNRNRLIKNVLMKFSKDDSEDIMNTAKSGDLMEHKDSGIVFEITAGTQKRDAIIAKYHKSEKNYRSVVHALFNKEFTDLILMPIQGFDPYEPMVKSLSEQSFKFDREKLKDFKKVSR